MTTLAAPTRTWTTVCPLEALPHERGVAALVEGEQVALFRTGVGALFAVGNRDPRSGAMVISRGLVGSRGDRLTVASPLYKQVFGLSDGRCLDDDAEAIPVHEVRVRHGQVEVRLTPDRDTRAHNVARHHSGSTVDLPKQGV